jgi:hypothetical protein
LRRWGVPREDVVQAITQRGGQSFTLEADLPAPEDNVREQVLDALRAYYVEHGRPVSIKTLAGKTHRRTQTVIDAVQDLVAAGMAQRLGQHGKCGVIPAVGE